MVIYNRTPLNLTQPPYSRNPHLPAPTMSLLRGFIGALVAFCVFGFATAEEPAGLGPHLQEQFRVGKLPNVTWAIGCQYAGNLPIQRGTNLSLYFWGIESEEGSLTAPAGRNNAPWTIWLNGYVARFFRVNSTSRSPVRTDVLLAHSGPGSSSLAGLLHEVCTAWSRSVTSRLTQVHQNGPIRLNADYTATENPYSWDKLADTFWIDQPV